MTMQDIILGLVALDLIFVLWLLLRKHEVKPEPPATIERYYIVREGQPIESDEASTRELFTAPEGRRPKSSGPTRIKVRGSK